MNGQWRNTKTGIVYPVECDGEGDIRDQCGDIIASVSFCEPWKKWREIGDSIASAMNGIAGLGIARVEDHEKAGKPCESEWERYEHNP